MKTSRSNYNNIIEFPRQYILGSNALDFNESDFEREEYMEEDMSGIIITFPDKGKISDIFAYAGMIISVVIIMSEILKWLMFM